MAMMTSSSSGSSGPPSSGPMKPGTYLALRRQAAGLSRADVARRLVSLPWAVGVRPEGHALERIEAQIAMTEEGRAIWTAAQAEMLLHAFSFDLSVYLALVDLSAAGPGSSLPEPQVCTGCGCSWHDACRMRDGCPCWWVRHDFCSRCADLAAAEREFAPGPTPPPPCHPHAALTELRP